MLSAFKEGYLRGFTSHLKNIEILWGIGVSIENRINGAQLFASIANYVSLEGDCEFGNFLEIVISIHFGG